MNFASDNYAGVHPKILAAIGEANVGSAVSYGDDKHTQELQEVFAAHFGSQASTYPVFNGTGANVVSLQALTSRFGAVICADTAHIHADECGAPEKVGGIKLLTVPTPDGKLTPELIARETHGLDDVHRAHPEVVSITQSTELGTVYTAAEIAAICDFAHAHKMWVHVDGARLANAAASLGQPLAAFTTDVGVDVVSFGGTKNGLLLGEAVVVLNPAAVVSRTGLDQVAYLRKMSMQLASKMRFVSAQFVALMSTELWLENATHANAMAARLANAVAEAVGDKVEIVRPVQANSVFAVLPAEITKKLQQDFPFYVWNHATGEVRWMASFETTEAQVDAFAVAITQAVAKP